MTHDYECTIHIAYCLESLERDVFVWFMPYLNCFGILFHQATGEIGTIDNYGAYLKRCPSSPLLAFGLGPPLRRSVGLRSKPSRGR